MNIEIYFETMKQAIKNVDFDACFEVSVEKIMDPKSNFYHHNRTYSEEMIKAKAQDWVLEKISYWKKFQNEILKTFENWEYGKKFVSCSDRETYLTYESAEGLSSTWVGEFCTDTPEVTIKNVQHVMCYFVFSTLQINNAEDYISKTLYLAQRTGLITPDQIVEVLGE